MTPYIIIKATFFDVKILHIIMNNKIIIFCIVITGLYISCGQDDVSSLKMGEDFVDGESGIVLNDTLSVKLSTVLIDSIQTSNSGMALVGNYYDATFGNIESQAVYRLDLPSSSFEDKDVFDSITLCLKHNSYYLGDTSQEFSLQVHELDTYLEDLALDQSSFYNFTKVKYKDEILGQMNYYPRPNKTDELGNTEELEFKLKDDFGLRLFNLFIEEADEVSDATKFYKYFYGIVLKCDENLDNSIMGYAVNDSSMYVKMYYHRTDGPKEELEAVFNADVSQYQFNSINADRSSTLLNTLIEQRNELSSTKTNNESYIQGGTGLMTKVEFPGLANVFELVLLNQIIKAELILEPTKKTKTINDNVLPPSLIVYTSNTANNLTSVLTSSDGSSTLTMDLVQDLSDDWDNKYYSIDITQYIINELLDGFFDPDFTLIVGLSGDDQQGTLKSLIFGGELNVDYKPKLKLYTYYY